MPISMSDTEMRVTAQIAQYANVDDMHAALSDINLYWKKKHHAQRMGIATGSANHIDLYVRAVLAAFDKSTNRKIVSLGSGDGAVETKIAQKLEQIGINDYEFHLHELSPLQNARAKNNFREAGLNGNMITFETNLNEWQPQNSYAAYIAHHSLHHIVELERLFDLVLQSMDAGATFSTFDMIGRNGHMRWPETHAIINALWHFLPESQRYHSILKFKSADFRDHDCSTQGFEGIRAQDILPELIKRFQFETFFAWGGLTDVFTGRGYGSNFSVNSPDDLKFIDLVDELNEVLLDLGVVKPTVICAVMQKEQPANPLRFKDRQPERMLRLPT